MTQPDLGNLGKRRSRHLETSGNAIRLATGLRGGVDWFYEEIGSI
jgi:hypothetical protein